MYEVVRSFYDLQDDNYAYIPGDSFPRNGVEVTAERLEELSTENNRRGVPLIVKKESKRGRPRKEG